MNQNKTIEYYNERKQDFIDATVNVDFSITQNKFIKKQP